MEKRIPKTKLYLLILLVFVVGACSKSNEITTPRTIESAINGTYTVRYCNHTEHIIKIEDCLIIGYLNLSDGHYSFASIEDADITEGMINRCCFIQHHEGNYDLTYREPYKPEYLLENIEVSNIVAGIHFGDKNCKAHPFEISISKETETVFFSTFYSEIIFWDISKSLND